jgi:hypothetical protein
MGAMEDKTNFRSTAFDGACRTILTASPEAIGVAFKFLDCGCSLLCGVSAQGNPVGELLHVSGQPARRGKKSPICFTCKKDDGMDRVVWEGIHWPGDESELPDKKKCFRPRLHRTRRLKTALDLAPDWSKSTPDR